MTHSHYVTGHFVTNRGHGCETLNSFVGFCEYDDELSVL